jgi:voltage-gated potassium channel
MATTAVAVIWFGHESTPPFTRAGDPDQTSRHTKDLTVPDGMPEVAPNRGENDRRRRVPLVLLDPLAVALVDRLRRRVSPQVTAPWRRFAIGVAMLGGVLAFGTCGYVLVGLPVFDAFYQTAITISTVGYGEVGPQDEIDRTYRVFTLMLVLVGAGTVVYTASVLLETLVQGAFDNGFRRRRMQREIDDMAGHVIVAGWGRVGQAIADYARRHGVAVVAIDQEPGTISPDDHVPFIVGDATDEDILSAAGLDRSATLIAALGRDSDNLALTFTARSMCADLFIVARVDNPRDARKFARAGANRVVNPYEIGGSRMAAIALRPHVTEFLDEVIHTDDHDVDISELTILAGSPAAGTTLADILSDGAVSAVIIAIKSNDGRYTANPPTSRTLDAGEVLIAVGSARQIESLSEAVAPASEDAIERPARGQRGS